MGTVNVSAPYMVTMQDSDHANVSFTLAQDISEIVKPWEAITVATVQGSDGRWQRLYVVKSRQPPRR